MTYNSAYTGPQIDAAARLASIIFDDLPAMLADARDYTSHTAGDVFWTAAEGFRYRVAASDATDHHLTTAGGVKVYVQPSDDGVYNFKAFNPAADGVTDDHPVLVKALAAELSGDQGPTIYFPAGAYFMGATVELVSIVRLVGGTPGMNGTTDKGPNLIFASDTLGICINRTDTLSTGLRTAGTRADGAVIDGLRISSSGGTDADAHGIWLRARARIANCQVIGFPGHGLYIRAAFEDVDPLVKGNANVFAVETSAFISNKNCGVYIDGPDTNGGTFINADFTQNGRWGIFDSSFLGNVYIGCHIDANGLASKGGNSSAQSCFVSYAGNRYQAMPTATLAQLVATTPGTDATIWSLRGAGAANSGAGIPTWLPDQVEGTYFPGGGVRTEGSVNYGAFIGCYNEAPWAMSIEGPSAVIGGHMLNYLNGGRLEVTGGNRVKAPAVTSDDSSVSATIGGDSANRSILSFIDKSEPTQGWPWRLRYVNGDFVMDNANLRTAFRLTSQSTTRQFGTSAPIPYLFHLDTIGLGSGSNARRQTTGTAAPTTGAWGRGDIVWNINAAAAGWAGWICVTAGTPGTWKQFGAIGA